MRVVVFLPAARVESGAGGGEKRGSKYLGCTHLFYDGWCSTGQQQYHTNNGRTEFLRGCRYLVGSATFSNAPKMFFCTPTLCRRGGPGHLCIGSYFIKSRPATNGEWAHLAVHGLKLDALIFAGNLRTRTCCTPGVFHLTDPLKVTFDEADNVTPLG